MSDSATLLNQLKIDRSVPPPSGPTTNRRWIWIGGGIGLAVLLGLGAWLLTKDRAVAVQTMTIESAEGATGSAQGAVLDASGYIVARRIATVSAKVTGRVSSILIEEGQQVEAGQVLATLDPIDAVAQRQLAQAQVEASAAQAGSLQAQLTEARRNVERLSVLVKQQLVSRQQYDQAVATRDALASQLTAAQRGTDVSRQQLRIAGNGVDNNTVRAPFAGVVIAKSAQVGEIISPLSAGGGFTRTGIGTIVDMDSLEVEVDVSENYIGRVKHGMPTETILNAYPDWKIPGTVIAVIPTADRGKATIKVRIALDAKDARVVPDMGARVSFLEERKPDQVKAKPSFLIPASAIVDVNGKQNVFVVVEDKAQARPVKTGRSIGSDSEILDGISPGDVVITEPGDAIRNGTPVKKTDSTTDKE